MGLFLYYAWHSVKNQVRKIFKTWVLVFILVCGLIGGLIGYGAASLEEMAEENAQTEEVEEIVEDDDVYEATFNTDFGISGPQAFELGIGAVTVIAFTIHILNAEKNGTKLFLPADVTLLFASPMKPQSVLMFRLATQLSTILAGYIYMLFQLPNMMINLHMTLWSALSVFAAWGFIMIFGKVLQMLLYLLESKYSNVKKYTRPVLYAVLGAVVAGFILYSGIAKGSWLESAAAYFNAPFTRWIPVWGWIKGFCMSVFEQKPLAALIFAVLLIGTAALLITAISSMDVDFYEDAMKNSEETAALIEKMQNSKRITFSTKGKFSEKLERDGIGRGQGPSVYFFKTIYNRFRFAKFRFFTKTMITYILAAAALGAVMRMVVRSTSVVPMMFLLAGMVFFRSLGNPMNEDVQMPYFTLMPSSTFQKLFFSLVSGTASCFLDVLPAVIIGTLVTGGDLLNALLWMIPVLTVDFYATCVGTFLDLSIPESIGKTVKQVIQIMFIYFGLLPDIALIAIGFVLGNEFFAVASVSFVNLFLGFLFFGLAGVCADPAEGKQVVRVKEEGDPLKKIWSWNGISLTVILVITGVVQVLLGILLKSQLDNQLILYLFTFAPLYLIAVPVGLLVMRKYKPAVLTQRKLPLKYWFILPMICLFIMYAGNFIGTGITNIIANLFHKTADNPLSEYVLGNDVWLRSLFFVILAPVIEEFIFRKQLISRTAAYDERSAVLISGLLFGLFHGNFTQFFYAAGLGILFGVVYVRTGRLRYTIFLHMFVNFLGSIAGPELINNLAKMEILPAMTPADYLKAPELILLVLYLSVIIMMALAGIVFFAYEKKNFSFAPAEWQTEPKGTLRRYWKTPGMILFTAAVLVLFVLNM